MTERDRFHAGLHGILAVVLCIVGASAHAQAPADRAVDALEHPLAGKQQIIRERVGRLEDRMFQLAEVLSEAEPENAKKLVVALQKSRELGVGAGMDAVIAMLESGEFSGIVDKQKKVSTDLDRLLRLLLNEFNNADEVEREIKRLEEMLRKLDEIVREQRKERVDSKTASDLSRARTGLKEAIAELQDIIRRQAAAAAATAEAIAGKRPAAGAKLEGSQAAVRDQAEMLAEQLAELSTPEAAKQVAGAGAEMKAAEEKLAASKLPEAERNQQEALKKLEDALKRLERRREALRKDPDLPKMANEQRGTAGKTGELAKQMSGGKGGKQGGEGKKQDGENAAPMPGQQQVQQARQHMNRAAGKLDEKEPTEAGPEQDKALKQLGQARDEMEERLRQLRQEQQAELLADLEARFRAMLAKQGEINKATTALDQKGTGNWKRADQLLAGKLSADERGLAGEAETALKMLTDDGTSIVFPQVVEQLRDDMNNAASLLGAANVGRITQEVETDIVRTLRDLIQAIEQMQKSGGGGGGQGGEGGEPPLLPASAELKLLRALQVRVNLRTRAFGEIRGDEPTLSEELSGQIRKIAERQDRVSDMARDMIDRVNAP